MKLLLTLIVLLVIAVGAGVVTARLGFWPVAATSRPSSAEITLAKPALHASLQRQAAGLQNPVTPSTDVLTAGLKTFKANCAGCHGVRGQPSQWGTNNFYPRVPQFADHPPDLTAGQIFVAVKYGIRYSGMGAWQGMMTDEEIWKVATFLEQIDKLPPEVEAGWASP